MNESTIWFSDLLPVRYPTFFRRLSRKLQQNNISFNLLKGTRAIWIRDFLPVSDGAGGYVQFKFDPGYLRAKKYRYLVSEPEPLWNDLGIRPVSSDLILDGGNIIRKEDILITTDFVKRYNPGWSEPEIISELKHKLKVSRVVIMPHQPNDFTGHADGMVRFIDKGRILVNDFRFEKETFRDKLFRVFEREGISIVLFTYEPDRISGNKDSAIGTYINYQVLGRNILFPEFGIPSDNKALGIIGAVFPDHNIIRIMSNEIAEEGGVLHCIAWSYGQD